MIFHQLSIALGVISLIGFFASSGKQKRISAFLLGLSLLLGIISFTALSPYSQPPSGQSESKRQQITPDQAEDTIYIDPILPNTNRATNLVKTGNYTVSTGKNRLCFSRLGDEAGYHGQLIRVDGREYNAGESGKCYPVTINKANVYVEFVYPPQSEVDTYVLNRKEKGGQGVYPFLEPVR